MNPFVRSWERFNSKIKRREIANRFDDFDRKCHRSVLKWAGHVARMRQYDSNRVTYLSNLAAQKLGVDSNHFETVLRLAIAWQASPHLDVGAAHV